MKKSIYLLGMAVAALSSCSQSDVVEMPENRAIGFSTFVNNNTRDAANEINTAGLTQINVFGLVSPTSETKWTKVYTNVKTEKAKSWKPEQTAYWEKNKKYTFAAYSDGNDVLENSKVTYSEDGSTLTFNNYTVGTKDLVACVNVTQNTGETINGTTPGAVPMTLNHMLSQVKFTFMNGDSRDYVMKISNLTIANAITTATGTLSSTGISWDKGANPTGSYTFEDLTDIAENALNTAFSTESILVIPQANSGLDVTFTATLYASDGTTEMASKNFKANLNYAGTTPESSTGKWTNGYRYNYTATINGSQITDPGELVEIIFAPTVDGWDNATDQGTIPTPQP